MLKLSDAVILGDSLRRRDYTIWLGHDDTPCGCALGGALLACGFKSIDGWGFLDDIKQQWPWLTAWKINEISNKFFPVCCGDMTIEELSDYIKTIEPKEEDGHSVRETDQGRVEVGVHG
jgi:hypothetical protein